MDNPIPNTHKFTSASVKRKEFTPGVPYTSAYSESETDTDGSNETLSIADTNLKLITCIPVNTPTYENIEVEDVDLVTSEHSDAVDDEAEKASTSHASTGSGRGRTFEVNAHKRTKTEAKVKSYGRYFVAADIGRATAPILVDTGADLSMCPVELKHLGKVTKITPIWVKGFSPIGRQRVTEKVRIKMNFGGAKYTSDFYVADSTHMMIGCDLLRNPYSGVSMNTRTSRIRFNDRSIYMDDNAEDAIRSLDRRNTDRPTKKKEIDEWGYTVRQTILRPKDWTPIEVCVQSKIENDVAFMTVWDDNDLSTPTYAPSAIVLPKNKRFKILIENRTDKRLMIPAGEKLGKIKSIADIPTQNNVGCYTMEEIRHALEDDDAPEVASTQLTPPEKAPEAESAGTTPVKLSELTNQDKVPVEKLAQMRDNGVVCDLQAVTNPPEVIVPDFNYDVDNLIKTEKQKSRKTKYWKNETQLTDKFGYKTLTSDHEAQMKQLIGGFKQVFQDEEHPEQFHKGLNITPIKIELKI